MPFPQQDTGLISARLDRPPGLVAPGLLFRLLLRRQGLLPNHALRPVQRIARPFPLGIASFDKTAPPAAVHGYPHRAQRHDPIHGFQQIAVMADDQGSAGPTRQKRRNRSAAVMIKIIGRLVQQEQIGCFKQHGCDTQTCTLTPAQTGHVAVQRQIRQTSIGQRLFQPFGQIPLGQLCVLQRPVPGFQPGHRRKRGSHAQRVWYRALIGLYLA